MYYLKLCKGLSYSNGIIKATKQRPDVYTGDKAAADAAVASGYFKLVADDGLILSDPARLDPLQLEDMKLDDLKRLAEKMGIDTAGFKKKSDYVDAIAAMEVIPDGEYERDDENEADYEGGE